MNTFVLFSQIRPHNSSSITPAVVCWHWIAIVFVQSSTQPCCVWDSITRLDNMMNTDFLLVAPYYLFVNVWETQTECTLTIQPCVHFVLSPKTVQQLNRCVLLLFACSVSLLHWKQTKSQPSGYTNECWYYGWVDAVFSEPNLIQSPCLCTVHHSTSMERCGGAGCWLRCSSGTALWLDVALHHIWWGWAPGTLHRALFLLS